MIFLLFNFFYKKKTDLIKYCSFQTAAHDLNQERYALSANVLTAHSVLLSHMALSHNPYYIIQSFLKLYHLAALIRDRKHPRLVTRFPEWKKRYSL